VAEVEATLDRINRASTEFLKIDLETALTFTNIARQTSDISRRERNCLAARKAYDAVERLVQKVDLNKQDKNTIKKGMQQLKTELEALGQTF
jgi:phosphoenolpyruvate carboxylase